MTGRILKGLAIILYILIVPMWIMEMFEIDIYLRQQVQDKKDKTKEQA